MNLFLLATTLKECAANHCDKHCIKMILELTQMLYFRPRNRFEELDQCYLVGGGTHPGSGLPTIYESGRIAANMICRQHGVPFVSKNTQV